MRLYGKASWGGIAVGRIHIHLSRREGSERRAGTAGEELDLYRNARRTAEEELERLRKRLDGAPSKQAEILEAHRMLLRDEEIEDRVLRDVDLFCADGIIRQIGRDLPCQAEETVDCRHLICYPGLVNTHHHLYQLFSRNLPEVQRMELFPWLQALYEIWKNLDRQVVHRQLVALSPEPLSEGSYQGVIGL